MHIMERRRFVCPIGCDTTSICIPRLIWLCFLYVSDANTLWLLWLLRDWFISRRVFMVVCKCWLTTSYVVVKLEKVLIGNGKVFAFMQQQTRFKRCSKLFELGNAHLSPVSCGCETVVDLTLGLIGLILHCQRDCHTSKMADKLMSHG